MQSDVASEITHSHTPQAVLDSTLADTPAQTEPDSALRRRDDSSAMSTEVGVAVGVVSGSGGEVVVEESGPVVYSDGEEEEEGFGGADVDDLAYEGDPLLYSDAEEGMYKLQSHVSP